MNGDKKLLTNNRKISNKKTFAPCKKHGALFSRPSHLLLLSQPVPFFAFFTPSSLFFPFTFPPASFSTLPLFPFHFLHPLSHSYSPHPSSHPSLLCLTYLTSYPLFAPPHPFSLPLLISPSVPFTFLPHPLSLPLLAKFLLSFPSP